VAKASEKFVRVIVRRPHAYRFRKDHPSSPIPGMVILDAEGAFVAGFAFKGEDQAKRLAAELEKHAK
jgi:hypothetical protein